jgi:DNA-binding transcriptional LysR family regulator
MQDGYDLAIRGAPLADSGLQASKLSTLPTCLCGSPEYFEQYGRPKHPDELVHHQWVIYKLTSSTLSLSKVSLSKVSLSKVSLSKGKSDFAVKMQGTVSTNNAAARTAFVEGGHGLGRIPVYDAQPKINNGTLESVLDDYKLADINVYGVYPPGSLGAKKLRLLIDYLKAYFKREAV